MLLTCAARKDVSQLKLAVLDLFGLFNLFGNQKPFTYCSSFDFNLIFFYSIGPV